MNGTCDHCRRALRTDDPAINYCGNDCRILYHRRITQSFDEWRPRTETRQRRAVAPGVAALLADRAAGTSSSATLSTTRAWAELADEAAMFDAGHNNELRLERRTRTR